jgi:hypothetical protein
LLVLFFEDEKEKDANSFMVFLIMSAIAILTADIPVLNGNDPSAWSVIGVSINKMNEYGGCPSDASFESNISHYPYCPNLFLASISIPVVLSEANLNQKTLQSLFLHQLQE